MLIPVLYISYIEILYLERYSIASLDFVPYFVATISAHTSPLPQSLTIKALHFTKQRSNSCSRRGPYIRLF